MDPVALVEALRGRADGAVERLFDRYAPWLFEYCETLLDRPEPAATALSSALLAAVDQIDRLADPERLELWLFALARNECLRLARRSPERFAGTVASASLQSGRDGVAGRVRRLRRPADHELQEVGTLVHRHGFDERGVVAVAGLPRWRARSIAAGPPPEPLAALPAGPPPEPPAESRTELLAVPPTAEPHAVEEPPGPLPAGLRERVLADAALSVRTAYWGEVAGPFRRSGFPVPLDRPIQARRTMLVAASLVAVVLIGLVAYSVPSGTRSNPTRSSGLSRIVPTVAPAEPSATGSPTPSASPTPSRPGAAARATPSARPSTPPRRATPTPSTRPVPTPEVPSDRRPAPDLRLFPNAIVGAGGMCIEAIAEFEVKTRTCAITAAQIWTAPGDGTIRMASKCLNAAGGDTDNGTQIDLANCDGSVAQRWNAGSTGDLVNAGSGRCVDGPNDLTPGGLETWDCNGKDFQRWAGPI